MYLEHDGYVLSLDTNTRSVTLHADTAHHKYIGMTMDIEKTVDKKKIRISNTTEEDNQEICLDALCNTNFEKLSIKGIYFHKHMLIVSVQTPWDFSNPRTRIISARQVFYMVFKRSLEPKATFLAILAGLDTLTKDRHSVFSL